MGKITFMVEPLGGFCHLNCPGCYLLRELRAGKLYRMTLPLLESFTRQALSFFPNESGNEIHIVWHGSDALQAGIPFFEHAMTLQRRYMPTGAGLTVANSIQTNGTRITRQWAQFFARNNIFVGVSFYGGDRDSHDRFCVDHAGHGTFDAAVAGIKLLIEYGVRFGVIHTVMRSTVPLLEQNLRAFLALGVRRLGINIFQHRPGLGPEMENETIDSDTYTALFFELLNLLELDEFKGLYVREIDDHRKAARGVVPQCCSHDGSGALDLRVTAHGLVTGCSLIENPPVFGDLTETPLVEILDGDAYRDFVRSVSDYPKECRSCPLLSVCHNGCPCNRIKGKYVGCQTRQTIIPYLAGAIDEKNLASR